jgi:hypothetical protein
VRIDLIKGELMMKKADLDKRFSEGRRIESTTIGIPHPPSKSGDDELDLLTLLRGTWISRAEGWNLIALPASPPDLKNPPASPATSFRLLMNQYGETLKFNVPDMGVPNRGLTLDTANKTDQLIDAITYEQIVVQKAVDDFPVSSNGVRAANGQPIHHEPGFFLHFLNQVMKGTSPDVVDTSGKEIEKELKIARMGTIPHGNSVLAMGFVSHENNIEDDDAFPERLKADGNGKEIKIDKNDVNNDAFLGGYLKPYKHFVNQHFFGCVNPSSGFPGFSPDNVHAILQNARSKLKISKMTVLTFDTKFKVAGVDVDAKFDPNNKPIAGFPISNVPFVKREANVTEMHAKFWIMELERTDQCCPPEFVMQYSQTVYLEFFDSPVDKDANGKPRRIRWPHVSINTLRKVDP